MQQGQSSGQQRGRGNAPSATPEELQKFSSGWEQLAQENLSSADYYFDSYAHFSIHEEMLKDRVRTGTYQRAVLQNAHLFKDKIVLDVGSGTGILSMFAAQAGAAHVYGIECSGIIDLARKVVADNGFQDHITFIQGKAEEVELPVDGVDIIISEWMGYFLLYESMLDTVIYCRDKWLKPNGLIFPDRARLYLGAIEDYEYRKEKLDGWKDVYGFNFGIAERCLIEEPIVDDVSSGAIVTNAHCILDLDLNTVTVKDLNFCTEFTLDVRRKDFIHALVAWFDVTFGACHKPLTLTTSPYAKYTHWKQTVFYTKHQMVVHERDTLKGMIAVKKSDKNPRDLDIKIHYDFLGRQSTCSATQFYRLR